MNLLNTRYQLQTDHPPIPEKNPKYPPTLKLVQAGFQTGGRLFPRAAGKQAYKLFATPRFRARHKQSDPLLEQAELFDVLYGKVLLKGYSWGQGERTVLLVHGWESRGTALRHFVPPLLEQGFRVVAFDGPGHGHSTGKRTNLPHFAGAVQALLKRVGNVQGLVAHSFGGAASSFALAQMPAGFSLPKMVFIAVPDSLSKVLEKTSHTLGLPSAAKKQFRRLIEKKLGGSLTEAYTHKMGLRASIDSALIVHDLKDPVVSFKEAESIFRAWNFSSLLSSDGYGHFQLMKNPDLVGEVARFLGE